MKSEVFEPLQGNLSNGGTVVASTWRIISWNCLMERCIRNIMLSSGNRCVSTTY